MDRLAALWRSYWGSCAPASGTSKPTVEAVVLEIAVESVSLIPVETQRSSRAFAVMDAVGLGLVKQGGIV